MTDRKGPWGRGIAILAIVALGTMTVAPAFSAKKPATKKQARKIARKIANKKINNRVPKLVEDGIAEVINLFGDSFVRVVPTGGADEAAARTAAPKVPLFSKGPLSVYGKCFRNDGGGPDVYGEFFIETTTAGAIFDSDEDALGGGATAAEFLNPDTPEVDRQLLSDSVSGGAFFDSSSNADWHAMAPDGTNLDGPVSVALKEGDLAGGNGVYGAGDVCLFGGFAAG